MKKLILVAICVLFVSTQVFALSNDKDINMIENALTKAFDTIKNVDVETLTKEYYDNNSAKYVAGISAFFADYPDAKEMVKNMLCEVEYEIVETKYVDANIVSKVKFVGPDFSKIIKRVLPRVLLKNFISLFTKKISDENVYDIVKSIYEEIQNEKKDPKKYKKVSCDFDFKFKKQGDMWALSNFADFESIINNILKIK